MSSQLSELLEPLRIEARANLDKARKDADAAGPGRRLMRVDLVSLRKALADPVLKEPMVKAMVAAFAASQGMAGGPVCECLTCGSRWAKDRSPGTAALIRMTRPDQISVALVCKQCVGQSRSRLRKAIVAAARQVFGADEEVLLAPGGRA
jgi:hypothetical protein